MQKKNNIDNLFDVNNNKIEKRGRPSKVNDELIFAPLYIIA